MLRGPAAVMKAPTDAAPSSAGTPGPKGADGATWAVGAGTPTAPANQNDLYLDLNTGDVYRNN